jgi:hypothetical protein
MLKTVKCGSFIKGFGNLLKKRCQAQFACDYIHSLLVGEMVYPGIVDRMNTQKDDVKISSNGVSYVILLSTFDNAGGA